jgi:hypothetical protein
MTEQNPLRIEISTEKGYLIVCNSILSKQTINRNGVGLNNLSQRSLLLTGKPIIIIENETTFTVKVPTLEPKI